MINDSTIQAEVFGNISIKSKTCHTDTFSCSDLVSVTKAPLPKTNRNFLLAIPFYGPNNQLVSISRQLFIAKLLNMIAVIPRIIRPDIKKNGHYSIYSVFRIAELEQPVVHEFCDESFVAVGEPMKLNYFALYSKSLDKYSVKCIYDATDSVKDYNEDFITLFNKITELKNKNHNVLYTNYGSRLLHAMHPGKVV